MFSFAGVISADGNAIRDNCTSFSDTSVLSLLELAEIKGLSTGVVTTTGITHATPATAYAHTPERNWENDAMAPKGCKDIGKLTGSDRHISDAGNPVFGKWYFLKTEILDSQ